MATLTLSALSAALLIAPVAMHRFLFRIRVKDELVAVTNGLAVVGLAVLSLCMIGALVLTSDWVAGSLAAWLCGVGAAVVLGSIWFVIPLALRRRAEEGRPDVVAGASDGRTGTHRTGQH